MRGQTSGRRSDGGAKIQQALPSITGWAEMQACQKCRLAIIVSSYVILGLGISTELLINVVSAFEASSVNSSVGII